MAKLVITTAILISFYCAVVVKGFDKNEAIADFVAIMESCKQEVEAKDSDIEELFNTMPPSTMEGKCLRACVMKKYEVMDANGKLDKNVVLEHLENFEDVSEEKMKIANEILDKCSETEVSDDHCEAAEEYGKCFKEESQAYDMKDELLF